MVVTTLQLKSAMDKQIREGRKSRGRKRLAQERAAYFQLMQQRHSNKEACAVVGINPRTGKVWHNGSHAHQGPVEGASPGYPPGTVLGRPWLLPVGVRAHPPAAGEDGHPRHRDRAGPHPSTIRREIRRNGTPFGSLIAFGPFLCCRQR